MPESPSNEAWNWTEEKRTIADLDQAASGYTAVHELAVSPDGERIAAPAVDEDEAFHVVVNGEPWEAEYEKAWQLSYTPDGRLFGLVQADDEWTVAVDGESWEETFDFVWNPKVSGGVIAVQVKQDSDYNLAFDGTPWEEGFLALRDYSLSPDGKHAVATVQLEKLAEADIWKYMEGVWGVVADGKPWDQRFINAYSPVINDQGRAAADVRLDITEYSLAEEQKVWEQRFSSIWEPVYRASGAITVPVRTPSGWTVAQEGKPIWDGRYVQAWQLVVSRDDRHLAAVVAPSFGRWTVAIDDRPWDVTFSDAVLRPVLSPDGTRAAAAVRDEGQWRICVDGRPSATGHPMVWDPVFSGGGKHVAAKVECDGGGFSLLVDGRLWRQRFDALWDPVFSPDEELVLVKGVEGSKYVRQVLPVADLS